MRTQYQIPIVFCLFLINCENKDDLAIPSDSVIELAYSKDYFYPAGFYYESIDSGSVYYENTVSISPMENRKDIWIELSTNDLNQARNWSHLSNQYSSVSRSIFKERITDKYFEFMRINITNPDDILLSRVHKDSYFKPLMDKFKDNDTIGKFTKANFAKFDVKELIEYLWSSGSIGYPTKVKESKITERPGSYEHHIQSITIVYGDWGLNDYIYLYDNMFLINKQNGIITMTQVLKEEIKGRYNPNPM